MNHTERLKKIESYGQAYYKLIVRYQDIVNCFEHSTYFANVSGHRELPQAVLA
jgi:hypothetical protein